MIWENQTDWCKTVFFCPGNYSHFVFIIAHQHKIVCVYKKVLQVQLGFQPFNKIQSWFPAATLLFFNNQKCSAVSQGDWDDEKKKLMLQRDWNGEESERENCVWTKVSVTLKTAHRKKADVLLSSLNKTLKPGRQQGSTSGHSKNFNQTKSAQNNCSDVQYKWVQTKPPQMHFGDKVFVSLFLNQAILERQECCLNSGS